MLRQLYTEFSMDNRVPKYFKIVERKGQTPWGKPCTYKLLVDFSGSIWGGFYSYRLAKQVMYLLIEKYGDELKTRGEFQ